ncbi:Transposon Tf2-9 polyprotein [Dictyocoela muelleri]|nr:Transposon Tf2-9 polyprotein [Dictyocoela muelleri]
MDDILVYTEQKQHHEVLKDVLSKLNSNHIKINMSKCEFYKRKIKFIKLNISEEGIQPDEDKISKFKIKRPKTKNTCKNCWDLSTTSKCSFQISSEKHYL